MIMHDTMGRGKPGWSKYVEYCSTQYIKYSVYST